jgi:hypothetical protein
MTAKLWLQIQRLMMAGFFAALLSAFLGLPAHAQDMAFRTVSVGDRNQCGGTCPEVIAAEGEITDQTPETFRDFVRSHLDASNLHAIVLMNSYGGKVVAAMQLGREFRQLGAAVVIAQPGVEHQSGGSCFSACVYALMGGKKRIVPPESNVGVHRMIAIEGGDALGFGEPSSPTIRLDDGTVASALKRYCASMGINPAVITLAEHTSPGRLHVLSRSEIAHWHLAVSSW